jgi:hypothetical protein
MKYNFKYEGLQQSKEEARAGGREGHFEVAKNLLAVGFS